ncbi:NAD(P)/FAD-dependent oxidoreductase [Flavobacterium psychrotolerans]|uniref:FAD-dependent oxidoreductase n=1 Tax=Flavobacterium psychrotolerans TaxID=2169410 RepID=A0A2U1JLT3_9FLAO|nr:NAD(P)/FAD-dependent oxidoreductase [Flavobacterium psychrotolerans]PWA05934.1 FAD-dependent oxidoreductase [Flavobacterium psychrotolerans]
MRNDKVIIIGGGVAGLTAAIHLSKIGIPVTIIEKNCFPKHKVCGEYISNEVLPYLNWLNINITSLQPTKITRLQFSTAKGKIIETILPLGGFGLSRFALDDFLCKKAITNGCEIIQETVENIVFENDEFTVRTSSNTILKSKIVVGAFGKRSNIDLKLNRKFILKKSHWLAVKAHYLGDFPNDMVGLHNFTGGYCGISKVENDIINICYLADYKTFQIYKTIDDYQDKVVFQNPFLKSIFENCTLFFEKPLTISQISFEKKQAVENHILMIGDTAGLIHPLCGNGMAMAIHSAKIVSELVQKYYNKEIKSRKELEYQYTYEWDFNFRKRLKTGNFLSTILQKSKLSEIFMSILILFPLLMRFIIKQTHGKPIILKT